MHELPADKWAILLKVLIYSYDDMHMTWYNYGYIIFFSTKEQKLVESHAMVGAISPQSSIPSSALAMNQNL